MPIRGRTNTASALRADRVALARTFVALDFETANRDPRSVCAIGLQRVHHGCLVHGVHRLVRPPPGPFSFTHVHGLTAADVRGAPSFGETWRAVVPLLRDAEFVAAHNAAFDRRVLRACCKAAGLELPRLGFECTMAWARAIWNPPRADLVSVSRMLGIPLAHHDPLSDARACAQVVLRVQRLLRESAGRDGGHRRVPFTEPS